MQVSGWSLQYAYDVNCIVAGGHHSFDLCTHAHSSDSNYSVWVKLDKNGHYLLIKGSWFSDVTSFFQITIACWAYGLIATMINI